MSLSPLTGSGLHCMKVFLYDGNCSFCFNLTKRLQAICLSKEIEFLSFRNIPSSQLSKIHPTLTEEVMAANVQFIYNGLRYPGFFAVRKLTFHLKFYRYFFWILYLPLIPIIGILVMNYLKLRTGHGTKG